MSIKKNIFLNNLKLHLGIKDLDEIKAEHLDRIIDYIKLHNDDEAVAELILKIPEFLSFAKDAIIMMNSIISELLQNGQTEVFSLKEIIEKLIEAIKNNNITEADKKEIFNLINKFSDILDNQLRENAKLRKNIFKGIMGVVAFSIVIAAYIVYKSSGGKNGDEFMAQVSTKLTEKT